MDGAIRGWDIRNPQTPICDLRGHSLAVRRIKVSFPKINHIVTISMHVFILFMSRLQGLYEKNESFMKIQLNVLFIQDHLCNITSFSPCLKKVFSFYVYRNLSLYTLYKYIKKNSIFHLKHDKNMFLFSQTSAFQRNILASVSYDFTTR